MNIVYISYQFLFLIVSVICRRSDYKRVIFGDYVKGEFEKNFQSSYDSLKEENSTITDLYEKYMSEEDLKLVRLQPEKRIGGQHNVTISNNRKEWLTLTTVSKRRPLIFIIDDFLFDDECEHIIKLAKDAGLTESILDGEAVDEMGEFNKIYDDIISFSFEAVNTNNDSHINVTELQRFFRSTFQNRLGELTVTEIMKKTYMDFNLDRRVEPWEWNLKNVTQLVLMLEENIKKDPSAKTRFSMQQWLAQTDSDDPVLRSLQDRLHKVTGLPLLMVRNGEPLQVVKYQPGGHYNCHLDSDQRYFENEFMDCCHYLNADIECAPCRFMTVLFYLEDDLEGGETAFPIAGVDPYANELTDSSGGSSEDWCDLTVHCSQAKVRVKPKKGRAVLWYNHFIHPDTNWTGAVDKNSLHGGCAVHKGTKWIANNWLNAGHVKKHDILTWLYNEEKGITQDSDDREIGLENDTVNNSENE